MNATQPIKGWNPLNRLPIDYYRLNFRLLSRLVGLTMMALSVLMLLPMLVSACYHEGALSGLAASAGIMGGAGATMYFIFGRKANYNLPERDSFWVTTVVWMLVPLAGVLPYMLTGSIDNFTDAAFESMSGFTTTGASVIEYPEDLSKGMLLWRSMTQWLGGLGLILMLIALVKDLQAGGYRLYEAEFSGTVQKKLHPHISKSVSLMWRIYVGITLALLLGLIICGNNVVESMCLSLSTISTGGFMTRSTGMTGFNAGSMLLVTLFMFESGINVALVYQLVTLKGRMLWNDEEFRVYVATYFSAVAICVAALLIEGNHMDESIWYSLFHVASTISTCGFYIDSPQHWSLWVSAITFVLIFVGASAGSTGGGLKLKRVMILAKYVRNFFLKMLHPNAVFTVRIGRNIVAVDYINKIFGFVFMYLMFVAMGAFVLTLCGSDIPNAVCMAATNISNLGPSPLLNNLGANMDYIRLSGVAKWTLMILMMAGRLEVFAVVAVFTPAYWRKR